MQSQIWFSGWKITTLLTLQVIILYFYFWRVRWKLTLPRKQCAWLIFFIIVLTLLVYLGFNLFYVPVPLDFALMFVLCGAAGIYEVIKYLHALNTP